VTKQPENKSLKCFSVKGATKPLERPIFSILRAPCGARGAHHRNTPTRRNIQSSSVKPSHARHSSKLKIDTTLNPACKGGPRPKLSLHPKLTPSTKYVHLSLAIYEKHRNVSSEYCDGFGYASLVLWLGASVTAGTGQRSGIQAAVAKWTSKTRTPRPLHFTSRGALMSESIWQKCLELTWLGADLAQEIKGSDSNCVHYGNWGGSNFNSHKVTVSIPTFDLFSHPRITPFCIFSLSYLCTCLELFPRRQSMQVHDLAKNEWILFTARKWMQSTHGNSSLRWLTFKIHK
jgi:hypothetical protein